VSLGRIARKVLGDRWFPAVGELYRSLFVDLDLAVEMMPSPPRGALVLDVGGGDGALLGRYLRRFPDARAAMLDLCPRIGIGLPPECRERVQLFPSTSLAAYAAQDRPKPDVLLVCDVVHHVPRADRARFFLDLRDLLRGHPAALVVKDIEPGTARATAAFLADRYISGDRSVSPAPSEEVVALVRSAFPDASSRATQLLTFDSPNYCLCFSV
jgi:2-polyprenyl-3-methyl-5-hydroxy-6-metoxy-1,4-benzoquinol methylase